MARFEDEVRWLMEALAPAADWTTQTDATVLIYGTSGRGSPRAVRVLDALADAKLLERKRVGRTTWFRVAAVPEPVCEDETEPTKVEGHIRDADLPRRSASA